MSKPSHQAKASTSGSSSVTKTSTDQAWLNGALSETSESIKSPPPGRFSTT